ncbi:hypothetical protein MWU38_02010 [Qipengyuania sp. S6317L1]|uniref:hypothetical protein n=1 Tax=Qipengyuania sp. S6317L1 TaxID=2926410 RepID=UPI001FF3EDB0|nr:hypothetical protein [Qipengyuania sp. S6317L1]MCK0098146.1 hypothetical protein [Qipengyuania sp. S6317L1]
MTKGKLKFSVAVYGALILLSLSPVAPLLGLIVALVFVAPVLALFALAGGIAGGYDADQFVAASFLALGTLSAFTALFLLYRAATAAEEGERDSARMMVSFAISVVTAPAVMYLCYRSLGIG